MSRAFSSARRTLITGAAGVAGLALSGCDQIVRAPQTRNFLRLGQAMSLAAQRTLLSGQRMAREFHERDLSPVFKINGSREATAPEYLALKANNFADYRLVIDGLAHAPLALSLSQLRSLAGRTQITRHDCVEGWSAIGKWSGVPLHVVLQLAQIDWRARYAVFHCFDTLTDGRGGQTPYYESIDMFDAFHPQTLLAYDLNGAPLIEAARRAAAPACRTPARLQAGQIYKAHFSGG